MDTSFLKKLPDIGHEGLRVVSCLAVVYFECTTARQKAEKTGYHTLREALCAYASSRACATQRVRHPQGVYKSGIARKGALAHRYLVYKEERKAYDVSFLNQRMSKFRMPPQRRSKR